MGFAIVFRIFLKPLLRRLALRTKTTLDEKILDAVINPLWLVILMLIADYFVSVYGLPLWISHVGRSLIAVLLALILYRLSRIFLFDVLAKRETPILDKRARETALHVVHNIIFAIIVFVTVSYVLFLWGIDVTPLLASAGIAGLAVGLALKDPLENFFYGILLALDPSFRVGDVVEIDGTLGTIHDIGLRNTKIVTFNGDLVTLPNATIARARIVNYHLPKDVVRVSVRVGASYDADPEEVKRTLVEVAGNSPYVLKDPAPQALFLEFGDFALIYELRFWTKLSNKMAALDDVNTRIWKAFREKGIEIPYPITTVYMKSTGS